MITYRYSYYLSDFLNTGLIDAENEADCISKILKGFYFPEIMHDLTVEIFDDNPTLLPVSKKDLKEKMLEYERCIEHYEKRNLEQQQKIDELDAQLLQYQIYVSDLTTAIKSICKDFCPNVG